MSVRLARIAVRFLCPALTTLLVVGVATSASAGGSSYRLVHDLGHVVRWDPCAGSVRYVVDPAGAPRGTLRDLRAAFAQTSAVTGLRFVYAGAWTPGMDHDGARRITIKFRSAASRYLGGRHVGTSVISGLRWARTTEIHRALIVLQRGYAAGLPRGFGSGVTRGHLFLHEIGHAVGLDDTAGRGQVMDGQMHAMARSTWRAGDVRGLRAVGAGRGCIDRTVD
jgi:hypothetical protein